MRPLFVWRCIVSRNPRLENMAGYRETVRHVRRMVADGAPCALCGRPIDLDAPQWVTRPDGRRVRAPWSLEVDHIKPASRGGALYDLANVQPSHRACNERKGAGGRSVSAVVGSTSRAW